MSNIQKENKGDEVTQDFKSKFLGDAEWMKDNLGHALCLAKWKQVSLHFCRRYEVKLNG